MQVMKTIINFLKRLVGGGDPAVTREGFFPMKRLALIGKLFWVGDQAKSGYLWLSLVLGCLVANAGANFLLGFTYKIFNNALVAKTPTAFLWAALFYAGAMLMQAVVAVFYAMFKTKLSLTWRLWLTPALFQLYYFKMAFLRMVAFKEIDNPDQRMTQDVQSFCDNSVNLFISFVDAVVNVAMFAFVLWALSITLTWTVLGYVAFGSVVVVYIGRKLPAINNNWSKSEADLRAVLQRTRTEAEPLAQYRGEKVAYAQSEQALKTVIGTLTDWMWLSVRMQLFTNFYYQVVPLIPMVMMGWYYTTCDASAHSCMEFGLIGQAQNAFQNMFNGLNLIVAQYGGIAAYRTVVNRIGAVYETLELIKTDRAMPGTFVQFAEGPDFKFDNVTMNTPYLDQVALKDVTHQIHKGEHLLVLGPGKSGKSLIANVCAGLYANGSGTVTMPSRDKVMFLSQDPWMPETTLREILTMNCNEVVSEARMREVLQVVELIWSPPEGSPDKPRDIIAQSGGLDKEQKWKEVLGPAEQQRLALARVILAKPEWVIIDQATSALEDANENMLYKILQSLGITYITTASDTTLVKLHRFVMEVPGDGTWKIFPADDYQKPSWQAWMKPFFGGRT
jgi:putative ATP-binding cassette transporter